MLNASTATAARRLDELAAGVRYVVLKPAQRQWEVRATLVDYTRISARGDTIDQALTELGKALIEVKVQQ